ncbi:MAG: uracil phosphoribosyltransferase [Paludibacteraceae bacterium]|nr:uracil phosphoribosyltransferase [Paludibacteraceae bacterium]
MIYVLDKQNSILGNFIKEIRSVEIQNDPLRFRKNIERIAQVMCYEISKTLNFASEEVQTPLGVSPTNVVADKIVVASILRAGLAMHNGVLEFFDRAENCFVSAYRKYIDETNFDVHIEYIAAPSLDGKTVILCDPMLATGSSMELAYKALFTHGTPARVIVCSIVSAQYAVDYISKVMPDCDIYTAVLDPELDSHKYIVPGLGDCGDLAFGDKL